MNEDTSPPVAAKTNGTRGKLDIHEVERDI